MRYRPCHNSECCVFASVIEGPWLVRESGGLKGVIYLCKYICRQAGVSLVKVLLLSAACGVFAAWFAAKK
jgi:hypothetical protein